MKLEAIKNNAFKGIGHQKVLNTLEFISDNNALITSGATLALGGIIRPIATLLTPDTKKKEKEITASKSVVSALTGFLMTSAIFKPVSKSLDNISKNPENFLSEKTIKNLKGNSNSLQNSSTYNFLEQTLKMSSEILSVIPKAILTTALILPFMNILFNKKEKKENNLTFKGYSEKMIANIIENHNIQEFAKKYENKNIIQHIMNFKDILATSCFIASVNMNKKINKEDKKTLSLNNAISTGITVLGGLGIKKITDTPFNHLIEKFKEANKNNIKVDKYVNGIKVLEPIAILGLVYYALTPIISTYLTGRINEKNKISKN